MGAALPGADEVGAVLRLEVERVVAGGDGLARSSTGRVVFVRGALAGETVEVRLTEVRRDLARGVAVAVPVVSPHRCEAPCPAVARGCGGCDWQHVTADGQLAAKVEVVRDALARTARLTEVDLVAGGAVSPFGYRTTMRFAVAADGRLGLRKASSNEVIALERCPVAHPLLEEMLGRVQVVGAHPPASPRSSGRGRGQRRSRSAPEVSLRVGVATGMRSAWCSDPQVELVGLADDVARGPEATVVERVLGADLQVSATSFFQSGPDAAALLGRTVAEVLGGSLTSGAHVIDLYGGVGLFAATVVPAVARVTVVEGSASACADARVNLVGRDAAVVESPVEHWHPTPADVVIADPSRRGLDKGAVEVIAATGAATVALVSCDPVALARDAVLLAEHGFRLDRAVVLDLFPQTHHVEVVTRFVR